MIHYLEKYFEKLFFNQQVETCITLYKGLQFFFESDIVKSIKNDELALDLYKPAYPLVQ